eukprot:TRINITY_DN18918_c1_g2_i1.p1 TRINITY_DN18918_c1_g2~~TRINITY_DN18918_c1_g2_i1.p1  ORF type:complete len:910 (-),score=161.03 TRINITY_DN18918_c1_g2_i1:193-2880(-)
MAIVAKASTMNSSTVDLVCQGGEEAPLLQNEGDVARKERDIEPSADCTQLVDRTESAESLSRDSSGDESSNDLVVRCPNSGASRSESPTLAPIYDMWCQWLDVVAAEDGDPADRPAASALRVLSEGSEVFSSFLQFLLQTAPPHSTENTDVASRRSFAAAKLACRALGGPEAATVSSVGGGEDFAEIFQVLIAELLRALHPASPACSIHICVLLQHLIGAHDPDICIALLQHHAPFVLLRALDRPGCSELLVGLLLGHDVQLPPILKSQSPKPINSATVHQVLDYLHVTDWPGFLCTVLERGVETIIREDGNIRGGHSLGEGSSPRATTLDRCTEQPCFPNKAGDTEACPTTPTRRSGRQNGWICREVGTRGSAAPQRDPDPLVELSELSTLPVLPSSPSPSCQMSQNFGVAGIPVVPGGTCVDPEKQRTVLETCSGRPPAETAGSLIASSLLPGEGVEFDCVADLPARTPLVAPSAPAAPDRKCPSSETITQLLQNDDLVSKEIDDKNLCSCKRHVTLLIDFLATLLETCGRASELASSQRSRQRFSPEAQAMNEVRLHLLSTVFFETTLVSHLFKLMCGGTAAFESANLALALLRDATNPRRTMSSKADSVILLFVPHVPALGDLLLHGMEQTVGATSGDDDGFDVVSQTAPWQPLPRQQQQQQQQHHHPQRLGALRVTAVQILAALCDLAPTRVLPLLKPAVWAALVRWFLTQRCNHIFQAASSRLLAAVALHGSAWLQQLVFSRNRLLDGLFDIVLAEGASTDNWHDLHNRTSTDRGESEISRARAEKSHVAVRHRRHPGGVGGAMFVIRTLTEVATARAATLEKGNGNERRPLAELNSCFVGSVSKSIACGQHDDDISESKPPSIATNSYVAQMVACAPQWSQVLCIVDR